MTTVYEQRAFCPWCRVVLIMSRDDIGWGKNTMDLDAWAEEVMEATVITRRKSIAGRLVMAGNIENPL